MRLRAKTKDNGRRNSKLKEDNGKDDDDRHASEQRQHLHAPKTQRKESEDWIIAENRFQHTFNFELVQDTDRRLPQFSSTLANDFNITKRRKATSWIRRIKTEYSFDDKDRNRRQTNGKPERSAGCTFVANSRFRSLQHAVFQPIYHALGKCKRLQERLTVERRLCYLAENTAWRYQQ